MNGLADFQEKIKELKVLIVGDVMLDHYLHGRADRISPEAPVPIVALKSSEYRLGGAANVALNVAAMGAQPLLCGVVGKDAAASIFSEKMEEQGLASNWIFSSKERPTTKKSRILANHQQLLRVDEESTATLSAEEEIVALANIQDILDHQKPDVIIFQDYNKGFLSIDLIQKVIALSKKYGIPTVVDPKFDNFTSFVGVDLFKPNLKELQEGLGKNVAVNEQELSAAAKSLAAKIDAQSILITLSEHGIYNFQNGRGRMIPTYPREIVDVCGAGDAVISICALALALKIDFNTIAKMANLAGGLVCESLGVVPIPFEAFMKELAALSLLSSTNS